MPMLSSRSSRHDQRARVVVGCIAFARVGHGENCVLQHACVVRHGQQMTGVQSRQGSMGSVGPLRHRPVERPAAATSARSAPAESSPCKPAPSSAMLFRASEDRPVSASHGAPHRFPAMRAPLPQWRSGLSNGTITPRFSASSSFACQYGVEMIALPAPSAMASVPETICASCR